MGNIGRVGKTCRIPSILYLQSTAPEQGSIEKSTVAASDCFVVTTSVVDLTAKTVTANSLAKACGELVEPCLTEPVRATTERTGDSAIDRTKLGNTQPIISPPIVFIASHNDSHASLRQILDPS